MSKLILMRHSKSVWNEKNLFTGWVDIPLSSQGIKQALEAGEKMKSLQIPVDIIFTSELIRAQMTAMLVMSCQDDKVPVILHHDTSKERADWRKIYSQVTEEEIIPVVTAWQLNERMYGELQGLNKTETAEKYGVDQVQRWRRSYDEPPPNGESLEMTIQRTVPYFEENILPELNKGRNVFVVAHGNSLRALIMDMEQLTPDQVLKLELETGEPIVYECVNRSFTRLKI